MYVYDLVLLDLDGDDGICLNVIYLFIYLFDMIDGFWSWDFCYYHVGLLEVSTFPFYYISIRVDGAEIFRDLCKHLMWLFLADVTVMSIGLFLNVGVLSTNVVRWDAGYTFIFVWHFKLSSYVSIIVQFVIARGMPLQLIKGSKVS